MVPLSSSNSATRLAMALRASSPSVRLHSALQAGTHPDPAFVGILVGRCAVEPDFFVRDMLTWALTRHPPAATIPLVLHEVTAGGPQARSQALHTLSKIGDPRGWSAITASVMSDPDPEVARSGWRAAVRLVPAGHERELARELGTQLGRGDREMQRSLSRALAQLGDVAIPVLQAYASEGAVRVRAHALATVRLVDDPEQDFDAAIAEAKRHVALARAPGPGAASC